MPPKKEAKEKVVKGDEADEMVLQYLKSVNRPYASTDVSANLKNKVPKAAAQKVLQALADRGDLTLKPYGKQSIFVYNQDKLPVMSPEDMASLGTDLTAAQDTLKEQKEQLKEMERSLSQSESIPKTSDLPSTIKQIQEENEITTRTLAPYRKTGDEPQVKPLSTEEIKQIDGNFTKWRKQWIDRRRVYKIITDQLSEVGIMINDEWRDDQGINQDDEEAQEIEKGEFCNPPIATRVNPKSKSNSNNSISTSSKSKSTTKSMSSSTTLVSKSISPSKRSVSDAASSQDLKPKKKAKKAAA